MWDARHSRQRCMPWHDPHGYGRRDDRWRSGRRVGQDAEDLGPYGADGAPGRDCRCRPVALQRCRQLCYRPVDLSRWRLRDALAMTELQIPDELGTVAALIARIQAHEMPFNFS